MEAKVRYKGKLVRFKVTDPQDHIQKCWMKGNYYEGGKNCLLPYLYNNGYFGKTIVDIGASVGNHAIFFGCVLNAKVIAIEPVKDSFLHMLDNIQRNKCNVQALNLGCSNRKGKDTMSYLGENHIGRYEIGPGDIEVHVDTLDNIIGNIKVDVIKMDTEDFNIPVLEGAANTLKNNKCDVFIECTTDEKLKEVETFMSGLGYKRTPGIKFRYTPMYKWSK